MTGTSLEELYPGVLIMDWTTADSFARLGLFPFITRHQAPPHPTVAYAGRLWRPGREHVITCYACLLAIPSVMTLGCNYASVVLINLPHHNYDCIRCLPNSLPVGRTLCYAYLTSLLYRVVTPFKTRAYHL